MRIRRFPRATSIPVLAALLLATPVALALAYQVRVSHIDGPPVQGEASHIEDSTLFLTELEDSEQPSELELDSVEEIEYYQRTDAVEVPSQYNLTVHLISGDVLIGRVVESDFDGFIFESMTFGRVPVNTDDVAQIDIRPNQQRREFQRDPDVDEAMEFAQDDALYLNPEPDVDFTDAAIGMLDQVTSDGVEFFDENEIIVGLVRWEEVLAVVRYAEPVEQPDEFQAIVMARNGERFTGEVLGLSDDVYRLRSYVLHPVVTDDEVDDEEVHDEGLVLEAHAGDLMKLTFRHGKFAYLSDMEPSRVEEFPYFGGPGAVEEDEEYWWRYQRDRAVDGSELALRDEEMREVRFSKGIGVHSYSRLSFDLDRDFSMFMADIGLDTSAGEQGSVAFRVFADNEREPRYESPVMRHDAPLRSIEVDVSGVRRIHLEVDFADNGDIQDRANWARARVIR